MTEAGAPVITLERAVFSVSEAARLLRVPTTTLRRWLDGDTRKGVQYGPVIRLEATGSDDVTWGEFVEAGFLREYRHLGSTLQKLRLLIDYLREDRPEMLYPLAHTRPFFDSVSRALILRSQEAGGPELLKQAPQYRGGGMQYIWADPVREFLEKVEFDGGVAQRYYPLRISGLVTIDPEVSFGIPHVMGIRTERLVEAHAAGESVAEIAKSWSLPIEAVEQALRWEMELLAA